MDPFQKFQKRSRVNNLLERCVVEFEMKVYEVHIIIKVMISKV